MLFVSGFAFVIDEDHSDDATVVERVRYQSQYFGLVGDGIRLTSYEVADFHEITSTSLLKNKL